MADQINETNFKQVLFIYATEKYKDKMQGFIDKYMEEYPDYNEELNDEFQLKNFIDWFMLEQPLPHSDKTIVEEYVEDHQNIDENMKQKLLDMKKVIRSEFMILSKKGRHLKLKDENTDKLYDVMMHADDSRINRGFMIIGRIHQFGEYYMLTGIYRIRAPASFMPDPNIIMNLFEEDKIKNLENIILTPHTKSTAIYNKYPPNWVDGICKALSISTTGQKSNKAKQIASTLYESIPELLEKFPEESKQALKFILEKRDYVKYGALKKYDDDMSFFWVTYPPESTIGILRLHGLLAVGKLPMNGRMNRIALIPHDLREILLTYIDNG